MLLCWGQYPILSQLTDTSPSLGLRAPNTILNVVLFPAPLTPMRPKHSPLLTVRLKVIYVSTPSVENSKISFYLKLSTALNFETHDL